MGNVCRYLSAATVGSAIGVPIVRTESIDNGCNYFAKGTQAQMTAKHMSAMMASKGADAKTQKMIEGITGGFASIFQTDKAEKSDADSGDGTVIVFNFSLDDNNAVAQMNLNRKGMAHVGGATTQDMPDIADEAFVTGDSQHHRPQGRQVDSRDVHDVPLQHHRGRTTRSKTGSSTLAVQCGVRPRRACVIASSVSSPHGKRL